MRSGSGKPANNVQQGGHLIKRLNWNKTRDSITVESESDPGIGFRKVSKKEKTKSEYDSWLSISIDVGKFD
jgi:hypothetical protein